MRKALILFGLIMSLVTAAFVAGSVFAKYRAGETVPLELSVRIRKVGSPEGADYLYDGQIHGISYDEEKMTAEGVTESADAGTYTVILSLKDPVTDCWEDGTRESKTVLLRIVPRPVILSSGSAWKAWDGTPLTEDSYTLSPGPLPEGNYLNVPEGTAVLTDALAEGDHLESVRITGSRTDAGSSDNVIEDARFLREDGRDVTGNYDVSYEYGLLTVDPVPIDLPEDAVYKWNGSEQEISFRNISSELSEAEPSGVTVLDALGNDITDDISAGTYFDGNSAYRLYGTGAWNQKWTFRMTLKPDRNHYWSVPLHGETTDARTVTLQILPEIGSAKHVIITGDDCSMVDAFSASGFAGLLGAPIIGVTTGAVSLNADELQAISRLSSPEGAHFWIMGGTGTLSAEIEAELISKIGDPAYHILSVKRIAGLDRLSTAWNILEWGLGTEGEVPSGWNENGTVIILPGGNVEPTFSIMTYAYATKTPVILTWRGYLWDYTNDKDGDGVEETNVPVREMLRRAGFRKAIIVGPESGTGSTYISQTCINQLKAAIPDIQIMRICGDSIGMLTNAICAWMESTSSESLSDPNVMRTGQYTYIAPEAVPCMQDSGRVMSLSDYKAVFKEIDVLGDAHLYIRTSSQLPYRFIMTLSDGDQEGDPVLHGFTSDESTGEVFFGNENDSPLLNFRPVAPEGYRFIGLGASWDPNTYSCTGGLIRMTLLDGYLAATEGRTRQIIMYALYVEEGKDPSDRRNYLRLKGSTSGGNYVKIPVSASDCRMIISAD